MKLSARQEKLHSWLDKQSLPVLMLVLAGFVFFFLARTLACLFIAYLYWSTGKTDLMFIWLVLAVMVMPSRLSKKD